MKTGWNLVFGSAAAVLRAGIIIIIISGSPLPLWKRRQNKPSKAFQSSEFWKAFLFCRKFKGKLNYMDRQDSRKTAMRWKMMVGSTFGSCYGLQSPFLTIPEKNVPYCFYCSGKT